MGSYLETCQSPFWREVFEKELDYLLRALKGHKKILSVGCGPAIIERGLQENGFNITGLDVSKEAIEGAPDSIRTVIGSAENMDFPDSSFDASIYVVSLQFIEDYEKAIEETQRVLMPHGKIVIMLLNTKSRFFNENIKDPESYMNNIKHKDFDIVTKAIEKYFSIQTEYYLGIKGQKIFPSNDHLLASLFIIQGTKK